MIEVTMRQLKQHRSLRKTTKQAKRDEDGGVTTEYIHFRQCLPGQSVHLRLRQRAMNCSTNRKEERHLLVEPKCTVAFIESPNYSSRGPISTTMARLEANCRSGKKPMDWPAKRWAETMLKIHCC